MIELREYIWERCEADDLKTDEIMKAISQYVIKARIEGAALGQGWTHTANCIELDKGNDPRKKEVPEMMRMMLDELEAELKKGV